MILRPLITVVLLLIVTNLTFCSSCHTPHFAAASKFNSVTRAYFKRGCGNTLTENSSCDGTCAYLGSGGPAVTTVAHCGHVCIALPAGKSDRDMNIEVSAAWQDDQRFTPPDQNYGLCGGINGPGPCAIDLPPKN